MKRKLISGLAAFPSADRLSPLDTFLDLLTAKGSLNDISNVIYIIFMSTVHLKSIVFAASLTELDFGLLIEATVTSTEDFL